MVAFKRFSSNTIHGKNTWYEAVVEEVEVTVWKADRDWGKGLWQYAHMFGPVLLKNRCRTFKDAKLAAIELTKGFQNV